MSLSAILTAEHIPLLEWSQSTFSNRDLKIYDAIARRRVIKTKQILKEDNNYE